MWSFFIKRLSNTCCVPRLEMLSAESPQVRRLDTDLKIQDVLFQYTMVIVSQAYLACYLITNFDVSPWRVIRASLIRTAISCGIDFVFNIISMFIQIHFHDIHICKVWLKHWRRHVAANIFIVVCIARYFGTSLSTTSGCLVRNTNLEIVQQYFRLDQGPWKIFEGQFIYTKE